MEKRKRPPRGDLPEDLRKAIELAWPNGVVDMLFDADESYFWGVYPKLAKAFRRMKGAQLAYEHAPEVEPSWSDDSDDDLPDPEPTRSYYLFFVAPEGPEFAFATEMAPRDEPAVEPVLGTGRTGWSVAVSLVAPFATVTVAEYEAYEDGTVSEPAIEFNGFVSGERFDIETGFRERNGEQPFQKLMKWRGRICAILAKYGIRVLLPEEWRRPVPWLRLDEDLVPGAENVRVLDAFFFQELF